MKGQTSLQSNAAGTSKCSIIIDKNSLNVLTCTIYKKVHSLLLLLLYFKVQADRRKLTSKSQRFTY